MNLLARLENLHQAYGDDVFREAADALSLEQLVADKLYRSLLLALSGDKSEKTSAIIDEALKAYEIARVLDITKNRGGEQ